MSVLSSENMITKQMQENLYINYLHQLVLYRYIFLLKRKRYTIFEEKK